MEWRDYFTQWPPMLPASAALIAMIILAMLGPLERVLLKDAGIPLLESFKASWTEGKANGLIEGSVLAMVLVVQPLLFGSFFLRTLKLILDQGPLHKARSRGDSLLYDDADGNKKKDVKSLLRAALGIQESVPPGLVASDNNTVAISGTLLERDERPETSLQIAVWILGKRGSLPHIGLAFASMALPLPVAILFGLPASIFAEFLMLFFVFFPSCFLYLTFLFAYVDAITPNTRQIKRSLSPLLERLNKSRYQIKRLSRRDQVDHVRITIIRAAVVNRDASIELSPKPHSHWHEEYFAEFPYLSYPSWSYSGKQRRRSLMKWLGTRLGWSDIVPPNARAVRQRDVLARAISDAGPMHNETKRIYLFFLQLRIAGSVAARRVTRRAVLSAITVKLHASILLRSYFDRQFRADVNEESQRQAAIAEMTNLPRVFRLFRAFGENRAGQYAFRASPFADGVLNSVPLLKKLTASLPII